MSWIRSEKSLLHHPKTAHLQVILKIDLDTLIGRLHRLWWWCLDYAIDGDLSKHPRKVIEKACGLPLKALILSNFVDKFPYVRIHDWYENQGAYLRSRYHKDPEKWQRIEKLYEKSKDESKDKSKTTPSGSPVKRTDVTDVTDVRYGRTDVTDVRDVRQSRSPSPPPASPASARAPSSGESWLSSEMPTPDNWLAWDYLRDALTIKERLMSEARESKATKILEIRE